MTADREHHSGTVPAAAEDALLDRHGDSPPAERAGGLGAGGIDLRDDRDPAPDRTGAGGMGAGGMVLDGPDRSERRDRVDGDDVRGVADGRPDEVGGPLLAGADQFRDRWEAVQAGFVDEPRRAVESADRLVAEAIEQLSSTFTTTRHGLEQQWSRGGEASTEDLRLALQRYRTFFDRLLRM